MTELRLCPTCGAPLPEGKGPEACPRCLMRAGFASTGGVGSSPSEGGGPPPVPTPEELADDFPQLEVLELLGRGGMGAVYKARQKSLDRIVALKLLTVGADADPAFAERFEREARALGSLSHPNVVGVYDSGKAGERYYLVMEYVDGTDLRQMERAGRVDPRDALSIVAQVCDALQYAHDRGVVHRDIKPENILVDRKGTVKIADFGLAKLLGQQSGVYTLTRSDQAMGTLHYMAPEQVEKPLAVDHRADIFSLGVVFYELLTGELPLGRFDPPSKKIEVDVRLDEVVLKTLEKDPPRRYQNASDVKVEVEGIAQGRAAPAGSVPPPPAAAVGAGAGHGGLDDKRPRRTGLLWALGLGTPAVAALAMTAGLALNTGGMNPHPAGRILFLLGLLVAGVMGLTFVALVILSLARTARERQSIGPWIVAGIVLAIVALPAGCTVAGLGVAFFGASRARAAEEAAQRQAVEARDRALETQERLRDGSGVEPFIYNIFGEEEAAEPAPPQPPEEPTDPASEPEPPSEPEPEEPR